jgi:hypothetical protein
MHAQIPRRPFAALGHGSGLRLGMTTKHYHGVMKKAVRVAELRRRLSE